MPGFYFSLSVPTVGPIFLHTEGFHSLYNLGEASNGQLEGVVSVLRLEGTGLSHSKLLRLLNLEGVDKHS